MLAGDDYIALSLIAVGGDGLISVISNARGTGPDVRAYKRAASA